MEFASLLGGGGGGKVAVSAANSITGAGADDRAAQLKELLPWLAVGAGIAGFLALVFLLTRKS